MNLRPPVRQFDVLERESVQETVGQLGLVGRLQEALSGEAWANIGILLPPTFRRLLLRQNRFIQGRQVSP